MSGGVFNSEWHQEYLAKRQAKDEAVRDQNRKALKGGPQLKAQRKPTNGHAESDLQIACVTWCRIQYPGSLLLSFANGAQLAGSAKQRKMRMGFLKKEGLHVGASDLVLILPDRVIFLECKQPGRYQSAPQKGFQQDVECMGYAYYVFRTLEEFQGIVNRAIQAVDAQ